MAADFVTMTTGAPIVQETIPETNFSSAASVVLLSLNLLQAAA